MPRAPFQLSSSTWKPSARSSESRARSVRHLDADGALLAEPAEPPLDVVAEIAADHPTVLRERRRARDVWGASQGRHRASVVSGAAFVRRARRGFRSRSRAAGTRHPERRPRRASRANARVASLSRPTTSNAGVCSFVGVRTTPRRSSSGRTPTSLPARRAARMRRLPCPKDPHQASIQPGWTNGEAPVVAASSSHSAASGSRLPATSSVTAGCM